MIEGNIIILPVVEIGESNLSEDGTIIYNLLKSETELSRGEIDEKHKQ